MKKNISQSMIKDLEAHRADELCGLVVEARHVNENFPDISSKSMDLGNYFQYILCGLKPKNGKIPQPEWKVAISDKAKKTFKKPEDRINDDMLVDWRTVHEQAVTVKFMLKKMGIKIVHIGKKFARKGMSADTDLICEWARGKAKSERFILDIKYSGLLHDKWNKHGWTMVHRDQRAYHKIQAEHYHLVTGLPFYYFIVSSTENSDIKFIKAEFDEFSLDQHLIKVKETREGYGFLVDIGFTASPGYIRCRKCPLYETCKQAAKVPQMEIVEFSIEEDE